MKRFLVLFLVSFFSFCVMGQDSLRMYINARNELTTSEFKNFYVDAHYKAGTMQLHGSVKEYFKEGTLFLKGRYSDNLRDGQFVAYHPNGEIKSVGVYQKGKRVGIWKHYYQNGKLMQEIEYLDGDGNFKVNAFYDWEGAQKIKDGSGKWIRSVLYHNKKGFPINRLITGSFKDGKLHGTWTISDLMSGKVLKKEKYKNGVLKEAVDRSIGGKVEKHSVSIISKNPDELRHLYNRYEQLKVDESVFSKEMLAGTPDEIKAAITEDKTTILNRRAGYRYGDRALMSYISRNLKIPLHLLAGGVSGRVIATLTIDPSGEATKIEIIQSVHPDFDREVIRVIKTIEDWIPAMASGQKIESQISIPVSFVNKGIIN